MPPPFDNVEDAIWGRLEWDDGLECFKADIEFSERCWIKVMLSPGNEDDSKSFFLYSRQRLEALKEGFDDIYRKVRDEYLVLYNDSWAHVVDGHGQKKGLGEITREKFDDIVRLESVWIYSDGKIELNLYDDEQLFHGHWINVVLNKNLTVQRTGLEG